MPGPRPFYAEYRQRQAASFQFTLVLQMNVLPTLLVADARRIVRELSPDVAPQSRTIDEVVEASISGRRFAWGLIGSFAAAATRAYV